MPKHGKKYRNAAAKIENEKRYNIDDALVLLKEIKYAKYDESVDLSFNLNVNPRHADQMVRGSVALPHGRGKAVKILVIAKGEKATEAKAAGADFVGAEDMVEKISDGWTDFDHTVATPDMMGQVGKVAKILGPRGLMPNPKTGTVTFDVEKIIKELKAGRLEFRVDKEGNVHVPIGLSNFSTEQLRDNLMSITESIARLKPASAKFPYFKSIGLSTTMSPGIKLDTSYASALL